MKNISHEESMLGNILILPESFKVDGKLKLLIPLEVRGEMTTTEHCYTFLSFPFLVILSLYSSVFIPKISVSNSSH